MCLDRDGQLPLIPWVGTVVVLGATGSASTFAPPAFSVSQLELCLTCRAGGHSSGDHVSDPRSLHRFAFPYPFRSFLPSMGAGLVADIPVGKAHVLTVIAAGSISNATVRVAEPRFRGTASLIQGQLARSPPVAFP